MKTNERYHGLDGLRAFSLLLGLLIYSGLCFVLPPGSWAVGTTAPTKFVAWMVYFVHSFRMGTFFVLAGFFAALVVEKRGVLAFVKDRAIRIAGVFLVALYPMKWLLAWVWIWGGVRTGWLKSPPDPNLKSWFLWTSGAATSESFPAITDQHFNRVTRRMKGSNFPKQVVAGRAG